MSRQIIQIICNVAIVIIKMGLVSVSKEMVEELERNEGLRVLARIIANAHLAACQRNATTAKTQGRNKKDESIPRIKRNRPHGKRGK